MHAEKYNITNIEREFLMTKALTLTKCITRIALMNNHHQHAFTLAEILITLGIISVVAAMTIPALIYNYKNKERSVRLKKAYSELSRAIILSQQEHGDISNWEGAPYHKTGMLEWSNEYIFKYMNKITSCEEGTNNKTCPTDSNKICDPLSKKCSTTGLKATIHILNNGQIIYIYGGGNPVNGKTNFLHILIDTNGVNGPNMHGKDVFTLTLSLSGNSYLPLQPFGKGNKRTDLLKNCTNTPETCAALLQYDNWEFRSDYPW